MVRRVVKYNPAFLSDPELIAAYSARLADLESLLCILRENDTDSNQHVLVIGPRGSGKTTLVLRVAAEVRRNPELRERWHPLTFAEESYEVGSPGEFWLEALFHLGQQTGAKRWVKAYEELKTEGDEIRLRDRALGQLLDFADTQKKRLLLIVENLNQLFGDQISKDDAWVLRHTLLNEPRLMLLATATTRFEAIENANMALYELFRPQELRPLGEAECRALWTSVTGAEPTDGRIRPLQILTGGNPRLLTIISSFGARLSFRELMGDLLQLVDDHTEYFKSHLDNLPPIERKVYLALADLWDPAGARQVARAARLETSKTSALLNRLVSRGAVLPLGGSARAKRYQVAERMYNIYHLIRRRGGASERVRAVVNFMVGFYTPEELIEATCRLAEEACGLEPELSRDHFAAYRAILDNAATRALRDRILKQTPALFLQAFGPYENVDEPSTGRAGPRSRDSGADKEQPYTETKERSPKVQQLLDKARDPATSADATQEFLLQAIQLAPGNSTLWLELAEIRHRRLRAYPEAEEAYREAVRLDPANGNAWSALGFFLSTTLGRPEEAEQTYRRGTEGARDAPWLWVKLGSLLMGRLGRIQDAEAAYRKATELDPEEPMAWVHLGEFLAKTDRGTEAKDVFRQALELGPDSSTIWSRFARFLAGAPERSAEAEAAYRKAIDLDPENQHLQLNLGRFLDSQPDRTREAEEAFRKAIELDPDSEHPWLDLARFLEGQINRGPDAEAAYRTAVERNPESSAAWLGYAQFLERCSDRFEEAEHAYRKATEVDPDWVWPWVDLGRFLCDSPGRLDEAETTLRKATEILPGFRWAWRELGRLLTKCARVEEAAQAYRRAIEVAPGDAMSWDKLGRFLETDCGENERAAEAYQRAAELGPGIPMIRGDLGRILRKLGRPADAEAAYRKAIELAPDKTWLLRSLVLLLLSDRKRSDEALELAEEFLGRRSEDTVALKMLSETFLECGTPAHLPRVVAWGKRAVELAPADADAHRVLALAALALGDVSTALENAKPSVANPGAVTASTKQTTDLFIRLAAAGSAQPALDILSAAQSADLLEPLIVGLRLCLGETVECAAEILEVGKDVAARIRFLAGEKKPQPKRSPNRRSSRASGTAD